MAYEAERDVLRDAWRLVKDISSITQDAISERSRILAPRFGQDSGVSAPYLSQMLGEAPKKHPRVDKLKLAALAFDSVVRDRAADVPIDNLVRVQSLLAHLLAEFRVQPIEWGTPGAPLAPQSFNLVRNSHLEDWGLRVLGDEKGSLFVSGGLGTGKSTMASRILARCQERGWRTATVFLDTETAESNEIGRVYEAIGHAIDLPTPPSDRYGLEAGLATWLQASPLPAVLMLDGFNLLYMMSDAGSELARAVTRGWIQKGRTGPANGPWRNLRLVVVYSYTRFTHGAAASSTGFAGFRSIECLPLERSETTALIATHYQHYHGTTPREDESEELAGAAEDWFAGHPLLVHDLVDRWARDLNRSHDPRAFVRETSPLQESHLRTLTAILESARTPHKLMQLRAGEDGNFVTIGVDGQIVKNLGIADFVSESEQVARYEWSSRFYAARLGPRLLRT